MTTCLPIIPVQQYSVHLFCLTLYQCIWQASGTFTSKCSGISAVSAALLASHCITTLLLAVIAKHSNVVLQISSANAEDINRNPVLRSLGGIFLVWLTFGFSIWYAFYFSVLAAVAGTLSILRGELRFVLLCAANVCLLLYHIPTAIPTCVTTIALTLQFPDCVC